MHLKIGIIPQGGTHIIQTNPSAGTNIVHTSHDHDYHDHDHFIPNNGFVPVTNTIASNGNAGSNTVQNVLGENHNTNFVHQSGKHTPDNTHTQSNDGGITVKVKITSADLPDMMVIKPGGNKTFKLIKSKLPHLHNHHHHPHHRGLKHKGKDPAGNNNVGINIYRTIDNHEYNKPAQPWNSHSWSWWNEIPNFFGHFFNLIS